MFLHMIYTDVKMIWTDLTWTSGVNILQKEEDFVLGIFGVLLGRIPGF